LNPDHSPKRGAESLSFFADGAVSSSPPSTPSRNWASLAHRPVSCWGASALPAGVAPPRFPQGLALRFGSLPRSLPLKRCREAHAGAASCRPRPINSAPSRPSPWKPFPHLGAWSVPNHSPEPPAPPKRVLEKDEIGENKERGEDAEEAEEDSWRTRTSALATASACAAASAASLLA
jgi:hypothetical protein